MQSNHSIIKIVALHFFVFMPNAVSGAFPSYISVDVKFTKCFNTVRVCTHQHERNPWHTINQLCNCNAKNFCLAVWQFPHAVHSPISSSVSSSSSSEERLRRRLSRFLPLRWVLLGRCLGTPLITRLGRVPLSKLPTSLPASSSSSSSSSAPDAAKSSSSEL